MPVLRAIAAIFLMQLVGEALVRLLGVPLPGSLLGLLLMFGCLVYMGRLPQGLRDTAGHILQHLMLLFIPAVAAVMLHFDRIRLEWLAFLLASIGATVVTILVTAFTFRWMLQRFGAKP